MARAVHVSGQGGSPLRGPLDDAADSTLSDGPSLPLSPSLPPSPPLSPSLPLPPPLPLSPPLPPLPPLSLLLLPPSLPLSVPFSLPPSLPLTTSLSLSPGQPKATQLAHVLDDTRRSSRARARTHARTHARTQMHAATLHTHSAYASCHASLTSPRHSYPCRPSHLCAATPPAWPESAVAAPSTSLLHR
jgi:hypothetical protein